MRKSRDVSVMLFLIYCTDLPIVTTYLDTDEISFERYA